MEPRYLAQVRRTSEQVQVSWKICSDVQAARNVQTVVQATSEERSPVLPIRRICLEVLMSVAEELSKSEQLF
jgi:hypothetical protein